MREAKVVSHQKVGKMQASLIIQTLFQLIGQNQVKIAYISNEFDNSVYQTLSSKNLPFVQNIQRQSKFFEKGSILIHHEAEVPNLNLISPFEFSIVFNENSPMDLPAHMNIILEKSGNGYWLNLHCMGEKPKFKINFWNSYTEKWLFDEKIHCQKRFEKNQIKASIIGNSQNVAFSNSILFKKFQFRISTICHF